VVPGPRTSSVPRHGMTGQEQRRCCCRCAIPTPWPVCSAGGQGHGASPLQALHAGGGCRAAQVAFAVALLPNAPAAHREYRLDPLDRHVRRIGVARRSVWSRVPWCRSEERPGSQVPLLEMTKELLDVLSGPDPAEAGQGSHEPVALSG